MVRVRVKLRDSRKVDGEEEKKKNYQSGKKMGIDP
jgi:hypothetical protein